MRNAIYVAFLALPMLAWDVNAQEAFELSGQVRGHNNQPKAMVHVYFEGPQPYFTLTGPDGTFVVPQFLAGKYSVRVQRGHNAQIFLRDIQQNRYLDLVVGW